MWREGRKQKAHCTTIYQDTHTPLYTIYIFTAAAVGAFRMRFGTIRSLLSTVCHNQQPASASAFVASSSTVRSSFYHRTTRLQQLFVPTLLLSLRLICRWNLDSRRDCGCLCESPSMFFPSSLSPIIFSLPPLPQNFFITHLPTTFLRRHVSLTTCRNSPSKCLLVCA